MSNPLLVDKEIDDVANAVDETQYETSSEYFKAILKEAIRAEAKHLVRWIEEYGFAVTGYGDEALGFNLPWERWEELKKKVGLDA